MVPREISFSWAAILWLLVLAGRAATAAEPDSTPARELLLFEEPTVSAAAKHVQPAREAPSTVTVITRDDIRRFGYRTLAEALHSVRGFYGSYDRNYSYIGVRGFLRPGDYNDRILLLVDGHTYNDDIYQTAYLGPEFGIDLEAVDHIEVIRGPGSALYGGNALLAVINVVTLSAADAPGVHALVETGSFARKRGQMSVGQTFENGTELFTSGSVLDVDGQGDLFYPEYDGPRTNHGVADEIDSERALNYFVSARHGGFFLTGGINRRDKQIPTGAFQTTFNDPGTKTTDGRQFADLTYTKQLLQDVTLTARSFYDGVFYHGTYVYGAGPTRLKNEDLVPSDWFGGELRARWDARAGHAVTAGAEYTYHPDATQKNFDLPSGITYLDDHRTYDTWGLYLQHEWLVVPAVTLVSGLRFDSYYDRIREVTPRLAAVWTARPETTVKLLYGRAFRPPNLYEQYYATSGSGLLSMPNPNLDSEKITTYEAAFEQGLWWNADGVLALYHYDIDDLIDQTIVGSGTNARLQYRNLQSVAANGAELEIRVPLPKGIRLRASYAIQKATSHGEDLTNSPHDLGSGGVLFPLPLGVEGGVDLVVVGPRKTLQRRTLDTVTLLGLTLRSATPVPRLHVSGSVYNLLDQRYFDPVGAELRQDRIEQDGVTFRVQLEYAF